MSFNLTVVLTGLVGFVENSNSASRARMCALLVNGDPDPDDPPHGKSSLDGSSLRRHRAFVSFPAAAIAGAAAGDCTGVWYLNGERLFIKTQDATGNDARGNPWKPGRNDFQIDQMKLGNGVPHPAKPADVPPSDWFSFSWAMDFQQACPRFCVDPHLLEAQPPKGRLAAQVFLDRGTLQTQSLTHAIWVFKPVVWPNSYRQVFAHEISLVYQGLDKACLVASSPDAPDWPKVLDLGSMQRNGEVAIEIVNTCDDNPLQWMKAEHPKADADTKWIYELADPDCAGWIRTELKGANQLLPIPVPDQILTDGIGTPRSGNCIPPRLGKASFTVPELDGHARAAGEPARED